jgi:hypothetical protein
MIRAEVGKKRKFRSLNQQQDGDREQNGFQLGSVKFHISIRTKSEFMRRLGECRRKTKRYHSSEEMQKDFGWRGEFMAGSGSVFLISGLISAAFP